MIHQKFVFKQFVIITLVVSIWIHISEVFRYFIFVMPRVKAFFDERKGIAEMDLGIFSVWGLWDTLLTGILVFVFWLFANVFGNNTRSVLLSAIIVWAAVFVIFWVAAVNMGFSNWSILLITLPLSLLEMIIGSWLVSKLYASSRWAVKDVSTSLMSTLF
ncbi:hypothetical protein ACFQ1M_04960 [Sungkyunkwania multivorans]|uniref:Uncharacterized protein n=1 Tax=Sungkyunkwania multivorans TaxID=1173618 RepID=A0ABW3CV08_9FLAO